jgi:hypothetical protein
VQRYVWGAGVNIVVLAGAQVFARVAAAAPWQPFDPRVLAFLSAMSGRLLRHPLSQAHIDAVGLAFFCRRSNLESLREQHGARCVSAVGRGLSFHIAPSNVPVNFAYSLVLGLLSGNSCVVRTSSREFAETSIICEVISDLLRDRAYSDLGDRISVVRYERDRATNDYFSALCDVRLIWGGDQTVGEIRQSPLPPRAVDVVFADRYSVCVIDAVGYVRDADKRAIAIGFYNDTYRNGQAACTAPRLLYWLGGAEVVRSAQTAFWSELDSVLIAKGVADSAIATVEKFTAACRLALDAPEVHAVRHQAMRVSRIEVPSLEVKGLTDTACGGGFFVEYRSERLDELKHAITPKFQTVTYIGMPAEAIAHQVAFAGVKGVDRIVPNGKASDFDLFWDGCDLMVTLSRHITVT